MAALEQIMQMRQQGMSERQIIESLRDQGISPKDINDALSQSQIKSAIDINQTQQNEQMPMDNFAKSNPYEELGMPSESMEEFSPLQREYQSTNAYKNQIIRGQPQNQMQQSIMSQSNFQEQPMNLQQLPPVQYQEPSTFSSPNFQQPKDYSYDAQQYPDNQQYPDAQQYPDNQQYPEYEYQQQQMNVETITEITEQIIDEKIEKIESSLSSLVKIKEEITFKIQKINKRLEKIENSFNELQMAILGKIGSYAHDLKNISEELHLTQDSFSKVLNPIIDNQRIISPEEDSNQPPARKKTKKDSEYFEKFLR